MIIFYLFLFFNQFDVLSKVIQIDSLDHIQKQLSPTTKLNNHTLPWQYNLQLNLETWKQIAKNGDLKQITLSRKPLKFNFFYLQEYVDQAKVILKRTFPA